jgi:hypothetical protein
MRIQTLTPTIAAQAATIAVRRVGRPKAQPAVVSACRSSTACIYIWHLYGALDQQSYLFLVPVYDRGVPLAERATE